MSKSNVFFLLIAVLAIAFALWFRQQVFSEKASPSNPANIAFITGGSGPYWQLTAAGAKEAAKDYDCNLTIKMPAEEESLHHQMAILSQLDHAKLDGIAFSPLDSKSQSQWINRVQQSTNIVTFDSDAPYSTRRGHIGTSNFAAGKLSAELTTEAIPEGGKILVLLANESKENLINRKSGYMEGVKYANTSDENSTESAQAQFEVVDYLYDEGNIENAKDNISKTLAEHPDLKCIVGMNSMHGPIILDFLSKSDKLDVIKIIAFDEEKQTLSGIEEGHIYATVAQDPYQFGYDTIRFLNSLFRDRGNNIPIVGGGTLLVPASAISKDNLQEFKKRLTARLGSAEE